MSIKTDDLIDAVLASGCEFDVAQNISDRNEVKKILQQYDTMWIVLPKGFPWHFNLMYMDGYEVSRSAISIEKIGGCKNWGEWHICGMYTNVLKHNDFTLELAADYDTKLFSSFYDDRCFTSRDKIPENGIELKATLAELLEKVRKASKELNMARIRKCAEEFEV